MLAFRLDCGWFGGADLEQVSFLRHWRAFEGFREVLWTSKSFYKALKASEKLKI